MSHEFWCDHTGPFVETAAGTVRGYKLDDLYIFKGMKYADARRFEMPEPVAPWEGIKDAFTYGPVAPTIQKPSVGPSPAHSLDPCFGYRFWPEDEACQYVNVWTKSINSDVRRPVMVWIHGGGYTTGSSVEQNSYDPSHLVSQNDVVVVSLNHRLNILGFLDMSEYGDKYAESRNVGMADIVEALRWVKKNISRFGGDPDNVTLFGQSGGGFKIQTLMQMPVAWDLFNKAILQSGAQYPYQDEEKKLADGKKTAAAVVKELGLTEENIDQIQNVPFEELSAAYKRVMPELRRQRIDCSFAPAKDDYYMGNPITCGFSEKFLRTPMIVGTCQACHYHVTGDISDYHMPEEKKYEKVRSRFGEHTDEMIDLFKKAYPGDDLLNLFHMDWFWRRGTFDLLDEKTEKSPVNCYSYLLDYTYKFYGGMPTFHGSCLPLVFNNTDSIMCFMEPGTVRLGNQMSRAWARFAETGDPNHPDMTEWKPYKPEGRYTMVFGAENRCVADHDRELIEKHFEYLPYRNSIELFGSYARKIGQ